MIGTEVIRSLKYRDRQKVIERAKDNIICQVKNVIIYTRKMEQKDEIAQIPAYSDECVSTPKAKRRLELDKK